MADNEHPPPAAQQPEVAGPEPAASRAEPGAGPPVAPPSQPPAIAPPAGAEPTAPPGPLPALRQLAEPVPIDAEQVRQFQQFQQFQELMRQQQELGTPPPPGQLQPLWPPQQPKRPLWQRVLRSKSFRKLVLMLIVVLGLLWAYQHYFGGPNEELPASQKGVVGTEENLRLPRDPYLAVRKVYDWIAQNSGPENTNEACLRFTREAAQMFATNMGYSNCAEAVQELHAEVTDPNAWTQSMPRSGPQPTGDTQVVSSCRDNVQGGDDGIQGGPPLGEFTLRIDPGSKDDQWIITGHEREPDDCGGVSTPPTS